VSHAHAQRNAEIIAAHGLGTPIATLALQYRLSGQRIKQVVTISAKRSPIERDADVLRALLDAAHSALASIERSADDPWVIQRAGRVLNDAERAGYVFDRRRAIP